MEEELQHQLDLQWDALEARSPEIRKIRREILRLITELHTSKEPELAALNEKLRAQHDEIERLEHSRAHRTEIEQQVVDLRGGELGQKQKTLAAELVDLDKQIAQLQAKRQTVALELRETSSIIESRAAKLERQLNGVPKVDAKAFEEIHATTEQLETEKAALSEAIAAIDGGKMLWLKVTLMLDELDGQLQSIGPETGQILAEAILALEADLAKASENSWKLLVVAIGHELETIKAAADAVHEIVFS